LDGEKAKRRNCQPDLGAVTMSRPSAISLFAGAGGLDHGLELAGFRVAVAVDVDAVRAETLSANMPHVSVLQMDVAATSTEDLLSASGLQPGEAALVAGGPPCQPFSKAAQWRGGRHGLDQRARLVFEFARVVMEAKPMAFLLENVPGLAGKLGNGHFEEFLQIVSRGYRVEHRVLNAVAYGVPQKRRRLFVVGFRKDLGVSPAFPEPTHGADSGRPYVTAGEAIGDLDDGVVRDDEVPGGKWGHLLSKIPPGMNYIWLTEKHSRRPVFRYRSRYWSFLLKLHPNRPSWTIPANPGPYTGPFHWRGRRLRIPEVKRLQTFPDDWVLAGSPREQWRQLGDAVPPLLAQRVGEAILSRLEGYL